MNTGKAQTWLEAFANSVNARDTNTTTDLFAQDGIWRDYVAFDWTLATYEGRGAIADFLSSVRPNARISDPVFEGASSADHGLFRFTTDIGPGRGHIRLRDGKAITLFTMLEGLEGRGRATAPASTEPEVVIIGGGQGGLALGAQLADLGVPYLIVDKNPRVGDQWRSRYKSLVLHDPVWYDHLPFMPFPDDWPVFTPKDQMGDWLEAYTETLDLNIWTGAEATGARHDRQTGTWNITIVRDGTAHHLKPRHVVFALGLSGFPRTPHFSGQDLFKGFQMHSSAYKGGEDLARQRVVVVGANNSAHDIASDLVSHGAYPVMIQRSSTLVVRQEDYCERVLGPLYSAKAIASGITTEAADILTAATPIRHLEHEHRAMWDQIRSERAPYYDRLTHAGFALDFAEDGTGLGLKYRRTASGYYIDVGAAEMVVDGRIGLRSGVSVARLDATGLHLSSGEYLTADGVVYATGYGTLTDWVGALVDQTVAEKVGPCWGYGSDTKGDPGPWEGELRNMWKPTAQDGLWFMGGNLAQTRFYSRRLAIQLAAACAGLTDAVV